MPRQFEYPANRTKTQRKDTEKLMFKLAAQQVDTIGSNKFKSKSPNYSDEIWAQLMIEALNSFQDGLENRIGSVDKKTARKLHQNAVKLVGPEAFTRIAHLVVTAAGPPAEQAIIENVRGKIDQMNMGLSQFLESDIDKAIYGQYSTYIMDMLNKPLSQQLAQQISKTLQYYASATGLSEDFASAMGSLAYQYQELADALTGYSAYGYRPEVSPMTEGLSLEESLAFEEQMPFKAMIIKAHKEFADKIRSIGNK